MYVVMVAFGELFISVILHRYGFHHNAEDDGKAVPRHDVRDIRSDSVTKFLFGKRHGGATSFGDHRLSVRIGRASRFPSTPPCPMCCPTLTFLPPSLHR